MRVDPAFLDSLDGCAAAIIQLQPTISIVQASATFEPFRSSVLHSPDLSADHFSTTLDGVIVDWTSLSLASGTARLIRGQQRCIGKSKQIGTPKDEPVDWFAVWSEIKVPGVEDQDKIRQHVALIKAVKWEETALGPIQDWPQSWLSAVTLCLSSPYAVGL